MARRADDELEQALDHLDHGAWQAAHEIVQRDEQSQLSCWAHGIVHILEGDLDNARYWYRRAQRALGEPIDVAAELAALRRAMKRTG
ncbi:MAG TPA: hypothetical protein VFA81_09035 [Burkholderiales bacterium]|nr:hypothetical protein [Burkholderiales bacterium]